MVNRIDETPGTPLEQRTKEVFDASLDSIDGRTQSALTQARHAALAELERKRASRWQLWGPLSGIAAAAFVLLVMFAPLRLTPTSVEGATMPFEDLDIVADADNLEMLQDLDFYAWLSSVELLPNDG